MKMCLTNENMMEINKRIKKSKSPILEPIYPRWVNKLETKIQKDFGKRCKSYAPFCFICRVWEALDIIKDVYQKPDDPSPIVSDKLKVKKGGQHLS